MPTSLPYREARGRISLPRSRRGLVFQKVSELFGGQELDSRVGAAYGEQSTVTSDDDIGPSGYGRFQHAVVGFVGSRREPLTGHHHGGDALDATDDRRRVRERDRQLRVAKYTV